MSTTITYARGADPSTLYQEYNTSDPTVVDLVAAGSPQGPASMVEILCRRATIEISQASEVAFVSASALVGDPSLLVGGAPLSPTAYSVWEYDFRGPHRIAGRTVFEPYSPSPMAIHRGNVSGAVGVRQRDTIEIPDNGSSIITFRCSAIRILVSSWGYIRVTWGT